MSNFNMKNASSFEHYCVEKLNNESLILNNGEKFIHWSNVPHTVLYDSGYINDYNRHRLVKLITLKEENNNINFLQDVGVDFIGIGTNNYISGQCKLYKSNISIEDVGTWINKTWIMNRKNPLNTGILCSATKCTRKLTEDMLALGLHHKKYDIDEFHKWNDEYKTRLSYDESKEVNVERREYQIETVKRSVEHFQSSLTKSNEERKVVLNLVCSLGKTLLIGDILRILDSNKCIIMMAPYKTDVENLYSRIPVLVNKEEKYEVLLYDSDKNAKIETLISVVQNCIKNNKKLIIFTTYKSAAEKISKYLYSNETISDDEEKVEDYLTDDLIDECDEEKVEDEDENVEFDEEENEDNSDKESSEDELEEDEVKTFLKNAFIVGDEVHEININNTLLLKMLNESRRAIYCTATLPKKFKEYVNYTLCINEYDFNFALQNKFVVDYRIMIPIALTSEESLDDVKEVVKDIDLNITQKAAFLMKGMLQTGSRRCIVYLSTKNDCIEFNKAWKLIGNEYHGHPTATFRINDDTTLNQRKEIIKQFENSENDHYLSVLCSCQCLNQAVNIVRCDCTFITNVSKSSDEIVMFQRFMRASRIDPLNSNKVNTCFLFCNDNDFTSLESCLTKLKNGLKDECFDKKVSVTNQTYDKQANINIVQKVVENQQVVNNYLVEWIDISQKGKLIQDVLMKVGKERVPKQKDVYILPNGIKINIGRIWCDSKIKNRYREIRVYLCENNIHYKKDYENYIAKKPFIKKKVLVSDKETLNVLLEIGKTRVPKYKEIYTFSDGRIINIDRIWRDIRKGISHKEIYEYLYKNEYYRKDIDKYLRKKDLSVTKDELKEAMMKSGITGIPNTSFVYILENGKKVNVGPTWSKIKTEGKNKDIMDYLIKNNKYYKEDYEKYLKYKEEKLTDDELIKIFMTVGEKRVPKVRDKYNLPNGKIINIGYMWNSIKTMNLHKEICNYLCKHNIHYKKDFENYKNKTKN